MTTITIDMEVLEQALRDLLSLSAGIDDRAGTDEKVPSIPMIRAALAAHDELERLRNGAERYRWLAEYLVSDDESHDDAIVAARTVEELNAVIDGARGTP